MTFIDRLFVSPASVMSFWSKGDQEYAARKTEDGTLAILETGERPESDWRLFLQHPDEEAAVTESLRPFFPTRSNIRYFNSECSRASRIFDRVRAGTLTTWPENEPMLLREIECDERSRPKDVHNENYLLIFRQLLVEDWGIILPPLGCFGKEIVRLEFRPGLPCAAAMERAVQCIIEAALGTGLDVVQQSLINDGARRFDIVQYQGDNGLSLTQHFDITDIYGLDLPYLSFDP